MPSVNGVRQSLELQTPPKSSGSIAAKPSPIEHITARSSPTTSARSSRPESFQARNAAPSNVSLDGAEAPQRTNRFSISFPVVPSNSASPARSARSPVREAPSVVPESLAALTGPSDGNFLTAIAAQERKVLEFKEELAKAEAELAKLKKQWAQHESQKKKDETRKVTRLEPVQTSIAASPAEEDSDGGNAWMQQEMERRKALLNSNKSSSRTVFSGSKHARTLSLLSPAHSSASQPSSAPRPGIPPRKDSLSGTSRATQSSETRGNEPTRIARATTTPDLTVDGSNTLTQARSRSPDKELLLQTGKKVATDLRDGLWTFWEDLRQVTVGEEATKIEPPLLRSQSSTQHLPGVRKQRSKTSLQPMNSETAITNRHDAKWCAPSRPLKSKATTMSLMSAPSLADPAFFSEFSPPVNKRRSAAREHEPTSPSRPPLEHDAWDTWDETSPQGSTASSTMSDSTGPSTVSNASPRTSTEGDWTVKPASKSNGRGVDMSKKDSIPWPALADLGPKALRRTASHLMAEWENLPSSGPQKETHG